MNIILFDSGCTRFGGKDDRYRHIRDVLRLREGDSFKAGIINGDRGMATITDFGPDGLSFSFAPEGPDSSLFPLYVILAAVRPICMKRILRELVSLGAGRLVICTSELGERSYLESGLYRSGEYRDIMLSGAMQSGHTGLPEVLFPAGLAKALDCVEDAQVRLCLDVAGTTASLTSVPSGSPLAIAIGGERGWTDRERELFDSRGFIRTGLGNRILRSETASVAAAALALGRMNLI